MLSRCYVLRWIELLAQERKFAGIKYAQQSLHLSSDCMRLPKADALAEKQGCMTSVACPSSEVELLQSCDEDASSMHM
jgi:hypothetical protein